MKRSILGLAVFLAYMAVALIIDGLIFGPPVH